MLSNEPCVRTALSRKIKTNAKRMKSNLFCEISDDPMSIVFVLDLISFIGEYDIRANDTLVIR